MSFDPNRPAGREPFAPVPPETASFAPAPVVPTPPSFQVPRRRSSGLWLNVVLVLAALVATGGVAFAVGRNTAPVAAATGRGAGAFGGAFARGSFAPGASGAPDFGGGLGGGFRGGGGAGFSLAGTVKSVTGDTLTITTASGQDVEFSLGSATTYATQTAAAASAVTAGSKVEIQLDVTGGRRPSASGAPSGPIGTAATVTVVP